MRHLESILVGVTVGLAWFFLWDRFLRAAWGVSLYRRKAEDCGPRRERLKQMGRLRYVMLFGTLGYGFAFAVAMTVRDSIGGNDSSGWIGYVAELVFFCVVFGLFYGLRSWGDLQEPVPFPPTYPPQK